MQSSFLPVKSRFYFYISPLCLSIFLALIFLIGNVGEASSEDLYEVKLKKIPRNVLKEEYDGRRFKHPFAFSKEQVKSILQSIYFSRSIIFWRKPRALFPEVLSEKMALPISRALSKANPRQVVSFNIDHKHLKLEGQVFINAKGLNLRFLTVSNRSETFRQTGIWDDNWKLIERRGQKYRQYKDALGLPTEDLKWIVIHGKNLKPLLSGQSVPERKIPSIQSGFDEQKFLTDLREIKLDYKTGFLKREQYYNKLQNIIDQSGWNELKISRQMEIFKTISKEHLLPKK